MRTSLTVLCFIASKLLSAQTFNSPESVEYDAVNNRWLVGNNGAGTIVSCNPAISSTLPFANQIPSGPHGIEILGNVAYCCDGGYIKGFDLNTGAQSFSLNLSASFLNGLTTDGTNYLFATDFSAKKIYRICPANNTFNLMCTTIKTPNGIIYDGTNNRCVFVTWGSNSPIQAMSLADSTISTLATSTYSNSDGITRDPAGFWYVTCWGNNALVRWSPTFTTPTVVMTGLSGPADIDINAAGDSIGIPNSNSTTVVYYTSITTSIAAMEENGFDLFPNPSTSSCTVSLKKSKINCKAVLFDNEGKIVRQFYVTGNSFDIERGALAPGLYLLHVFDEESVLSLQGKIIFK